MLEAGLITCVEYAFWDTEEMLALSYMARDMGLLAVCVGKAMHGVRKMCLLVFAMEVLYFFFMLYWRRVFWKIELMVWGFGSGAFTIL